MRILLVEDDKKVASFIHKGLEEEGYAVDVAPDGEAGLFMGLDRLHDLIILDVMLPKKPGFQVLREQLRECEGLGQIVVCPGVQPLDLVLHGVSRGQEQHRRGHPLLT
jgi:DNA-binding response OmpR family regulator